MIARDERRARNESLFREVNERIAEVNAAFEVDGRCDFLCECGLEACTEAVSLARGEYEQVRRDATRFLVLPGHESASIETVVERAEHHFVVEKSGEAAALDPRS